MCTELLWRPRFSVVLSVSGASCIRIWRACMESTYLDCSDKANKSRISANYYNIPPDSERSIQSSTRTCTAAARVTGE